MGVVYPKWSYASIYTKKNSFYLVTKIYIPVRPTKKTLEVTSEDEDD